MWKHISFKNKYLTDMIEMTIENYGENESISHKEFIEHEYFENPAGDALIELALDEENNVLAGQYVINPHDFIFFGQKIRSVLSLNTLTRKAYRGQKIFTGLAEKGYEHAKNEGFEFCYGAPNPNSHPGFISKLGFSDLCEMPLFVRLLKPSKVVHEKFNKFLSILVSPLNIFFGARKIDDNNIVPLNDENIELMNVFWENVKDKYNIMGIRNAEYIHYRYFNSPTREYFPYIYLVDGNPVAFVVVRVREVARMTTGMIADFLFVKGYEKEAISLVKFISKKIKDLGAGLAGCIMLDHSDEVKILRKARFIKCPDKILPQPTPLIIKVFNDELSDMGIMDITNWFFTTGDYDVV